MSAADRVYRAIVANGYTGHGGGEGDLRDAAHEAAHAIAWDVAPPWTRGRISRSAPRRPADKFRAEAIARAVEGIVCARLDVAIAPLDERILIAAMEAMKFDRYKAGIDAWRTAILAAQEWPETLSIAGQILAMGAAE